MVAVVVSRQPGTASWRARRWIRRNLFSSVFNSVLTLVSVAVLALLAYTIGKFAFIDARWDIVEENRRLMFLGRFPSDEEWRLWPPVWLAGAVSGLAFGIWGRLSRRDLAWIAATLVFVFGFLAHGTNSALLALAVALAGAGYVLTYYVATDGVAARLARRATIVAAVALIPFSLAIISVGGPATALWGGYMLNVLIAAVAITFSLPLGILLALARRSSIRTVKYPAIAFIETVRAGPLLLWLFVSRFVLPEFLPSLFGLDDINLIIRVMAMFTLFTSAYIAEIVRGGLQSVPRGQVEAAEALGMGVITTTAFIVLPQALRAVIPALVGQLIALWKDTSLCFIVGLLDFVDASNASLFQAEFSGRQKELYLFVGLMFWIVAFAMSRLSLRVERSLGIGIR